MSADNMVRVVIPTSSEFLQQWHVWVHGKVAKHFKRDKERILDLAQRARLRLLTKDFVSRWFYKHLTDDLVDADQASVMLGGTPVRFLGALSPAFGSRSSADALWRISDILNYAKFDYERYFYSIQDHTLDTSKVIRLLGLGTLDSFGKFTPSETAYSTLESLYRQGRLRPSELTEHCCVEKLDTIPHLVGKCGISGCEQKHYSKGFCSGHYGSRKKKECSECEEGRKSLKERGVSLAHRWSDPASKKAVDKLRWNDSQLDGFLRGWNNTNKITSLPRYIMRTPDFATVDAGLLKYANMIIDNDVVNAFKSIGRNEDLPQSSVDSSDEVHEPIQLNSRKGSDEEEGANDEGISNAQDKADVISIINSAKLTNDEIDVITTMDLGGNTAKETAEKLGFPLVKVNKIRVSAMAKMRSVVKSENIALRA